MCGRECAGGCSAEPGQDHEPLLPVHGGIHGTCPLCRESSPPSPSGVSVAKGNITNLLLCPVVNPRLRACAARVIVVSLVCVCACVCVSVRVSVRRFSQ